MYIYPYRHPYYENILYSEFRKNNNPFLKNGQPYFTGGTKPEVYTAVQNYIDDYFYHYMLGFKRSDDFLRKFQIELKRIEHIYYSMLTTQLNENGIIIDSSIYNPLETERYFSGRDYDEKTWTKENSTNDNTVDTTSNSHSVGTSETNSTADGKTRSLNSVTPHSNIQEALVAPIDTPINWNFATSMQDGFSKSTTNTTVDTENTTDTTSNTTSKNIYEDAINTGNKNRTDFRHVKYTDRIRDIDLYQKVSDFLFNIPNCWDYLTANLRRNFLYEYYTD